MFWFFFGCEATTRRQFPSPCMLFSHVFKRVAPSAGLRRCVPRARAANSSGSLPDFARVWRNGDEPTIPRWPPRCSAARAEQVLSQREARYNFCDPIRISRASQALSDRCLARRKCGASARTGINEVPLGRCVRLRAVAIPGRFFGLRANRSVNEPARSVGRPRRRWHWHIRPTVGPARANRSFAPSWRPANCAEGFG